MHIYVYRQIKWHSEMSLSSQEGSGISRTQDLTWKCLKGVADAVTSFLKRVWIFICVNHITELFLIWKDLENIDTACTCYTTKIIGGQQILPVTAHWSHQPQQPGLIYQTCKAMRLCYGFRLKKTTKNMHYIQDKWSYAHDFAGWVSDCKTRGFLQLLCWVWCPSRWRQPVFCWVFAF